MAHARAPVRPGVSCLSHESVPIAMEVNATGAPPRELLERCLRVGSLRQRRAYAASRLAETQTALERATHEHDEAAAEIEAAEKELAEAEAECGTWLPSPEHMQDAEPANQPGALLTAENLARLPDGHSQGTYEPSEVSQSTQLTDVVARTKPAATAEQQERAQRLSNICDAFEACMDRMKSSYGVVAGALQCDSFREQVDAMREALTEAFPMIPKELFVGMHKLRKWRNAAQHGVDGIPWAAQPDGGGRYNAPALPTRSDAKKVIEFVNTLLSQLESEVGAAITPGSPRAIKPMQQPNTHSLAPRTMDEWPSLQEVVLAAAPTERQKQLLGERLFPLIAQREPHLAGKITGMLLELDNSELLVFLETPEELDVKIMEAIEVLQIDAWTPDGLQIHAATDKPTPAGTPPKSLKPAIAPPKKVLPVPSVHASVPTDASLCVACLDPGVTEALLLKLFESYGPVHSISICRGSMCSSANRRRSLAHAYVNFHSVVDAECAKEGLNLRLINGRECLISRRGVLTEAVLQDRFTEARSRQEVLPLVVITNLERSIGSKAMYDTFCAFGNIDACKVAIDCQGHNHGVGLVLFQTEASARLTVQKVNGMMLNDHIVTVSALPLETCTDMESAAARAKLVGAVLDTFFSEDWGCSDLWGLLGC